MASALPAESTLPAENRPAGDLPAKGPTTEDPSAEGPSAGDLPAKGPSAEGLTAEGPTTSRPVGRDLTSEVLLHPRSIAFIGASTNPESLGGRPLGLLARYGFAGRVYPVNPTHTEIQGLPTYPSITDVPEAVDIAMVVVRANLVPGVLRDCARAGVKVAMVLSSGFGEGLGEGADLRAEIVELLGTTSMRVLGPNCEGLASLPASAPLSFSPILDAAKSGAPLRRGGISVVSQSGGLGFAVAQWGSQVGLGFNYVISTGNEIDVDALEVAALLVEDPDTEVVIAVVEGFQQPERFGPLSDRFTELGKRLVVAKMGRSVPGARGALAHTGHEVGRPGGYPELFAAHGIMQANDEEELVDIVRAVAKCTPMRGSRIGVLTTSGGAGIWLADACADFGLDVPVLSEATQRELTGHMPGFGSPVNPVDLTAQFIAGGSFAPAVEVLLRSGEVDGVILATSLALSGRLERDRDALARLRRDYDLPIAVYTYTNPARACVELLGELQLPWYLSSRRAARGLAALVTAGRNAR
jgi:acyl-CoA synthetase (NDP forming)